MKIGLIISSLIFSSSIFAQNTDKTCKRMDRMEHFLKDSIQINIQQQSKVSSLHAEYCPKFQAAIALDSLEGSNKEQLKALRKELRNKYKEILTAEQIKTVKQKKKAIKKYRKENPKKKRDAQSMTNKMAEKLNLTDAQKPLILALNKKLMADRKSIRQNDNDLDKEAMKDLRVKYRADLKEILTADQIALMKSERKNEK
jgi:Spy/CpxP family protein refolding chaperone